MPPSPSLHHPYTYGSSEKPCHPEEARRASFETRLRFAKPLLRMTRRAVSKGVFQSFLLKMKATSQHLKILRNVGIVRATKDSLYVSCRLNLNQEEPTRAVLRML